MPVGGTQLTGPNINQGSPVSVTHVLNLGNGIWIVGMVDSAANILKMVKIEITSKDKFNWLATKYNSAPTTVCKNTHTFAETCFTGIEKTENFCNVNLVITVTEDVHKASMTKCNAEKGVAEWKWRGVDRRKRSRSHEIKNDET